MYCKKNEKISKNIDILVNIKKIKKNQINQVGLKSVKRCLRIIF